MGEISEDIAQKNLHLEQSETYLEGQKDNLEPNPLLPAVIHRPNLYYSKICQKGNWERENMYNFLWNRKKYNLSDPQRNSPFGGME